MSQEKRPPTYLESLISLLGMAFIVGFGYIVFQIRIEMLMVFSAILAALLAKRIGYTWKELEWAFAHKLTQSTPIILLIWLIGMVIASFIFSGFIPMVIYYGLKIVNPQYIYLCSFLVCIFLSTATGTSWGSAGTAGVAMMGIAAGLDVSLPITAAAVISGAVFGDKISPLSETTNLAPLCAGTTLYRHIQSMLWTSVPAATIAGIVFWLVGRDLDVTSHSLSAEAVSMIESLAEIYRFHPLVLIPFLVVVVCAILKLPPNPTMLGASLVAIGIGVLYQGFDLATGLNASVMGFDVSMITSAEVPENVQTLLNRGGMRSMAGVVLIVYCGYAYASIISKTGFLETAIRPLIHNTKNRVSLICAVLITNFLIAACSGTSYAAFIISGEMYKKATLDLGLDLRVLSRSMEDSGTVMLPLVPWSGAGAFYAATLGVTTWGAAGYGPWTINAYMNPIMALVLAIFGIGMYKLSAEEQALALEEYELEQQEL